MLGDDLSADALRGVDLPHKALVALRLSRRDRQRHRGKARAGAARPDRKTARTLGERAEPQAGAVIDLDAADPAVRIRIELDVDVVCAGCCGALRYFDEAGGAANAERGGRRRDRHAAGLGDGRRHECHRALGDVEHRGVVLAAVLINVIIDRDLRVGPEIECGFIVEGDAERGTGRGLDHVVEIDVVLQLERDRILVADDGRNTGQRRDVSNRFVAGGLRGRRRGGSRRRLRRGRLRRLGLCQPHQATGFLCMRGAAQRDTGQERER